MFWIRPLRVFLNLLARALVTWPFGTWIGFGLVVPSSFPSSLKVFVLKSSPTSKGLQSVTLKVALTLYSPGKCNSHALSLIRLGTRKQLRLPLCWKYLFPHVQPNPIVVRKSAFGAHCRVLPSHVRCLTNSAFFFPSKLARSDKGNGVKSNGVKGFKP